MIDNIVLDHRLFDYSKVKGPLLAVPQSMFKSVMNNKFSKPIISPYLKYFNTKQSSKSNSKVSKNGLRKLSEQDILSGIALAKKERAEGKLIYL